MTSYRQIEANRRNALKSTGPQTAAGKQSSRRNALRHGLTAETVIGALEDAEDYKAFEAAVIADYDAQSAVERELVLQLASILWRLRRATTMETGLFEIQADHLQNYWENRRLLSDSRDAIHTLFRRAEPDPKMKGHKTVEFARCFFCVWRICLISRLIGSADMRPHFGVRPVGFSLRSMDWIGVNHRSE